MTKSISEQPAIFATTFVLVRRAVYRAVLLVSLVLIAAPPRVVFGQASQQEQQQEQQRQQEEQQRQQQEQQQRDQQQRDEQQRQQQEQQRRQQQQEQQQRVQQQPEHISNDSTPSSKANSLTTRPVAQPPVSEVKSAAPEPDLRHRICDNGPCKEPEPKPTAPPVRAKVCEGTACQPCPAGQSSGNDGCAPPPSAKVVAPQACPGSQVWDGNQCAAVGGQPAAAGSTDCTGPTAIGQSTILRLRAAGLRKNDACGQNSKAQECQQAEGQYNSVLNEYMGFLGSVPSECRPGLPDPTAI